MPKCSAVGRFGVSLAVASVRFCAIRLLATGVPFVAGFSADFSACTEGEGCVSKLLGRPGPLCPNCGDGCEVSGFVDPKPVRDVGVPVIPMVFAVELPSCAKLMGLEIGLVPVLKLMGLEIGLPVLVVEIGGGILKLKAEESVLGPIPLVGEILLAI